VTVSLPKPEADPVETCADVSALGALCGYAPRVRLDVGIPRFVEWYQAWRQMRERRIGGR
jgi:UDP-glucuronate 4-epimerase